MGKRLRAVSWNLNGGPGSTNRRLEVAWQALASLDADIALLQEAKRVPEWVRGGWQVFVEAAGVGSKRGGWGSCVLVRKESAARRWPLYEKDPCLADLEGYVVTAGVELPAVGEALVASVHAPPDKVRAEQVPLEAEEFEALRLEPTGDWGERKQAVWYSDYVFEALRRNITRGSRFLIGGDWNTGRLFDNDPRWDPPTGMAFFVRARRKGWVDCHALLGKQEERSYFGAKGEACHLQLDHLFCDRRTAQALEECEVVAEARFLEASDHAPLVAEFEFG